MAGIIPQSFIDDLLERTDIVDVIDSRVKLKKAGKNYSACCPFHEEKTPSFTVSPDKQFYYCFGCGANGNSLGFIMDYERQSFPDAIESLAKTAGLEVPREQSGDPQQRARDEAKEKARRLLYSLMEQASDYYQTQLRQHPQKDVPVNYLKRRGLTGEIAKKYGVGFAPPGWDNLHQELVVSNETQELLLEGGMLIYNEDKDRVYDRFRDRIIFPIRDSRGRVIGFGGRVLGDDKPKYLNSPETPIFHKGKELYGLFEARQAYRQLPRLLVVEGYMDVVALAQYGIGYGVATLGTACGEDHLKRAFRFTNEIVFCFDGDAAGRKAAKRAMENTLAAMEDGRQVKFLYMPEGEDPDTLVRQIGADKFTRLIEGASPLENFLFEELAQGLDVQTMEGRARLCKLAVPLLDVLPNGVYRELMFEQLARRTGLSRDALRLLLEELPESDESGAEAKTYQSQATTPRPQEPQPTPAYVGRHTNSQAPKKSSSLILPSDELAVALLLYQPSLAQANIDYEGLRDSSQASIQLLVDLMDLLRQRPDFTSGQIMGHWQGTYGAEATEAIKPLLMKASLFQQAKTLNSEEEKASFQPGVEFAETVEFLLKQQQQQGCETIIQQLNHKPASEWTEADKRLYAKAVAARANQ